MRTNSASPVRASIHVGDGESRSEALEAYHARLGALMLALTNELSHVTRLTIPVWIDSSVRRLYQFAMLDRERFRLWAPSFGGAAPPAAIEILSRIVARQLDFAVKDVRRALLAIGLGLVNAVLLGEEEVVRRTGASGALGRERLEQQLVLSSLDAWSAALRREEVSGDPASHA